MSSIKKYCVLGALLGFAFSPLAFGEAHVAMWKQQEVRFVYRGYITTYNCQALELKVWQVLRAVGAHESTMIRAKSCNVLQPHGSAPTQVASMRISVVSPAMLTPELKAELASTVARTELLERFGIRSVSNVEFQAVWVERDLSRHQKLRMEAGDCELLQQLRDQVLSKLSIQFLARDSSCSLSTHRLRKPRLKVLALVPMPHADSVRYRKEAVGG